MLRDGQQDGVKRVDKGCVGDNVLRTRQGLPHCSRSQQSRRQSCTRMDALQRVNPRNALHPPIIARLKVLNSESAVFHRVVKGGTALKTSRSTCKRGACSGCKQSDFAACWQYPAQRPVWLTFPIRLGTKIVTSSLTNKFKTSMFRLMVCTDPSSALSQRGMKNTCVVP